MREMSRRCADAQSGRCHVPRDVFRFGPELPRRGWGKHPRCALLILCMNRVHEHQVCAGTTRVFICLSDELRHQTEDGVVQRCTSNG
ncbi:hypothetical protein D4764_15G0003950 [Takifugu flavidus]|uniref:Uncharacterized protein n=1 Tax=Takifugu flavidus TaxID=433684 RepID=A0A5C6P2M6_9TELE|nr:hypothetical protein D4764_15G0003950 [Takifugu flavidus]